MSQIDDNETLRLVACRSKKLNPAQQKYPAHEKEISLSEALEDWRQCLLGAEVLVYTDNSALRFLQHIPRPAARKVRWLEKLQQFTTSKTIVHIPCNQNTAADALPRNQEFKEAALTTPKIFLAELFLGRKAFSKQLSSLATILSVATEPVAPKTIFCWPTESLTRR